jgi:hypothetical protein
MRKQFLRWWRKYVKRHELENIADLKLWKQLAWQTYKKGQKE